jgi:hypothetical protein
VSSRIASDDRGRPIVIVSAGPDCGQRYRVLGNCIESSTEAPGRVVWLGASTGHRNPVTARRMRNADPIALDPNANGRYQPTGHGRWNGDFMSDPDDVLADAAARELALSQT